MKAKKQPDPDSPAAWINCEICRAQNSFGGGHWAWHRFCRAELNPIALLQFVEREQFGVVGDVIAGYVKAVTGMDIEAARAALVDEASSSDARPTPMEGSQASGSATDRDLRTEIAHLTEERNNAQDDAQANWQSVKRLKGELAALTEVHERLRTLSAKLWETAEAYRIHSSPLREQDVALEVDFLEAREAIRALLSPREGTQLLEDQELTNDVTRRDKTGNSTDDPPQPPTGR